MRSPKSRASSPRRSIRNAPEAAPSRRNNRMRLLHTMLRVNNLDESLKFYCDKLGMKLLRKNDFPGGEFTLAFVGYGDEKETAVIELTWNWGTSKDEIGTAYGHVALGGDDISAPTTSTKPAPT